MKKQWQNFLKLSLNGETIGKITANVIDFAVLEIENSKTFENYRKVGLESLIKHR